jgi:pectinesterase
MKPARISFLSVSIALIACFIVSGPAPLAAATSAIQSQLAGKITCVVAADGSGNYTTVQAAIDAIPDSNPTTKLIFIKNGTYHEKILCPYKKTNLILVGANVDSCILSYNDASLETIALNGFNSYSFRADPDGFEAMNLTFQNTATTAQAVALHTNGDRQVFLHCKISGYQDAYYNNIRTRGYFKDCCFQGTVDFMYGFGINLFDSCRITCLATGGCMTAPATSKNYRFGYVFRNCQIIPGPSATSFYLGRPWFPYAHTVVMNSWEDTKLSAAGWQTWAGREDTCFFREYTCTGPGFKPASRATWAGQLTAQAAAPYQLDTIFSHLTYPQGPTADTAEVNAILTRWLVSTTPNMETIADTMLKCGRNAIPPIPTTDWAPLVDTSSIYAVIKANTKMFLDTTATGVIDDQQRVRSGQRLTLVRSSRGISFEVPGAGIRSLAVYDLCGRQVFFRTVSCTGSRVAISCGAGSLNPGVYVYSIVANDKLITGNFLY